MHGMPGLDRIDSRSVRNSQFVPRAKKSMSASVYTSEQRESGLAQALEIPNNEQDEEQETEMGVRLVPLREDCESEEEKNSSGSGGAAEDERGGAID